MDQAILVALVMLVCVLTMLVLGIPISISIGLASTIAMPLRMPWVQRHRRYYRRQFLLIAGNTLFHTGGEYHE